MPDFLNFLLLRVYFDKIGCNRRHIVVDAYRILDHNLWNLNTVPPCVKHCHHLSDIDVLGISG